MTRCAPDPSRCPSVLIFDCVCRLLKFLECSEDRSNEHRGHGGVALRVVGWIRLVHRNVTTERLRLRGAGIWMPARVELSDWCQREAKP